MWAAGAGPADLTAPLTFDLDSSIVGVYGRGKQGAAFGYTKVRGYHPQFATCAQTGMVLFSRLRGGAAGSARGAKSFLTETVSRVRNASASGQLTVRADSAFFSKAVLHTAAKFDVKFSVTVRQDDKSRAANEAIDDTAWQPIPHWLSTPEVSYALWRRAIATEADLLWRVRTDRGGPTPIHLGDLPDGSWLAHLQQTHSAAARAAEPMLVRVIDYAIEDGRDNPGAYRLLTTLTDPAEASAVDLAASYAERWEVELTFDELKTHQRGPRTVQHCAASPRTWSCRRSGATCAATTRSAP